MVKVCLLGASGNIGQQSIQMLKKYSNNFSLCAFSVGHHSRYISGIVKKFKNIKYICVKRSRQAKYYKNKFPKITFFVGEKGLEQIISSCRCKYIINALSGFAGVKPSITALKMNKTLLLANKETLVVAGELINRLIKQGRGRLFPIDSEHVAIKKCLSVDSENVEKIILTASGGAVRNLKYKDLLNVTKKDILKHPTWKMGQKITVDSSTMINKTFEIIEAYYLFGYKTNRIDVLMHDESHVHSLVKYNNSTFRADVSKPDMKSCIKYALFLGNIPFETFLVNDYREFKNYHFHPFSMDKYPLIRWGQFVIDRQGLSGAVLNAASEEADKAFLNDEISFLDISRLIDYCMYSFGNRLHPSYEQLKRADRRTRNLVRKLIRNGEYK